MTYPKHVAVVVGLFALLVAGSAIAAQIPIASQTELTHYLQNTPPDTSPLNALSPGGRKRFLTQLEFGERGISSISFDDAVNELTHPQIVRLFTLFGTEAVAPEGLTPAEQARRKQERTHDATARGCAVKSCEESEVELHYDALVLHKIATSTAAAQRVISAGERYDHLFGAYQTADHLRHASSLDLRLIRRAAEYVVSRTASARHIAHLQLDLAEMQRRDMLTDKDYVPLHQALISTRNFAGAMALAQQHPDMGDAAVPTYQAPATLPAGLPTALSIDAHNASMSRESVDLSAPLRIVVVASCHFSRDAARAIAADTQLQPIFAQHATWLADQGESFAAVNDWNREFPQQRIHIAWQNSEWSMLNSWAMPTFYVFHHGQLVNQFSGWHGMSSLKQSLREAGALK
ncbi:MAG: hypothetical protein ACTS5I_06090 [Rhodanobacter sp.]